METRDSSLPSVTVVVPCYNAQGTVEMCIEACLAQDYPGVEIIFVDDGSTDATKQILARYEGITVLSQENKGPAAARNAGWRRGSGDIICFTDADCIPNRRWVSRLLQSFRQPRVGAAGGGYEIANRESWLARGIHAEIRLRHKRMPRDVDYLGSFNVSYRRAVLEKAGGFDETFLRASGEDNDLSYRVKKMGYTLVFDPDNCVAHHHPEAFWRYMKQQFWHGYWRIRLYKKHSERLGGDDYANLLDFLQLPVSLMAATAWMMSWAHEVMLGIAIALTTSILVAQVPMTHAIAQQTRDKRIYPFGIVMGARALARGLGMARALVGCSPGEFLDLLKAFIRVLVGR